MGVGAEPCPHFTEGGTEWTGTREWLECHSGPGHGAGQPHSAPRSRSGALPGGSPHPPPARGLLPRGSPGVTCGVTWHTPGELGEAGATPQLSVQVRGPLASAGAGLSGRWNRGGVRGTLGPLGGLPRALAPLPFQFCLFLPPGAEFGEGREALVPTPFPWEVQWAREPGAVGALLL